MSSAYGEVIDLQRWFGEGERIADVVTEMRELANWLERICAEGALVSQVSAGQFGVYTEDAALARKFGLERCRFSQRPSELH